MKCWYTDCPEEAVGVYNANIGIDVEGRAIYDRFPLCIAHFNYWFRRVMRFGTQNNHIFRLFEDGETTNNLQVDGRNMDDSERQALEKRKEVWVDY